MERFGTRLCCVNLVDSHYCSDPAKFISVCLTSLNTMLQIELPHINVMSKVDQIQKFGKLNYNIDFYTDVLDLGFLVEQMSEDPFTKKYKKLNSALTDLIQGYSLVTFVPLAIDDKERMMNVKNQVDKANGFCFGSQEERNMRAMMSSAMGGVDFEYLKTADIREKYMAEEDEDGEGTPAQKKKKETRFGNDLDNIEMEPGFQI